MSLTASESTWALFGGLASVLSVASLLGALLKWRIARGLPHSVIDNLNARIKAWWVMIAVIGLAFVLGRAGAIVLFLVISGFALYEFLRISTTHAGDRGALFICFGVFLPMQYGLIWVEWYALYSVLIPIYAFLLLPILSVLSGDTGRFLERTSNVQWGLMICVLCISHVPALLMLEIPGFEGRQILLIAFLVLVVQGSDVLQYVWGKLLGKRLVAPTLSPSKTVEGLVGGVLSASALGAAMWWITPFEPWQAGLMALLICLMGFLGGLVMSAIKRDRGIKDWGHLIQGHGGMLDRLDSVCFSAPVFFHLTKYWWT